MTNAVEAYLDQLFDLLAGSGARGRRVLLEAQAHLEEAVEHAMASGQTREEAERNAIARFGSPPEIARAHADAGSLSLAAAFGRVFAAGWLLTSVAGLAFGLVGVLNAIFARMMGPNFVTDDPADMTYTADRCRELGVANGDAIACRAASVAHHLEEAVRGPLAIGALALVLLALFVIARRAPRLRVLTRLPNAAMTATAGAVGFGGVGLVLLVYGVLELSFGQRVEVGAHLAEGLAGVAASLIFLPQAWRNVSVADA